ncbi:MAG: pilus assembly protein TadG-related protein, partial [Clostridia bacterium]|nr:pilus assembly protein TadG-related protein [Clostridia bacterium]
MKKILKRKEKGDIALIAIFATIVILTIVAFIVDFGLIYFQSARLQNAVDSTTVAVAHNLMAEDSTVKATVEKYMKDNGVDITEKGSGTITPGKLRTKITYGDDDAIVIIDKKGLKTEETDGTDDDDKYITAGYLKVTVAVNCKGYWAAFSGLDKKQIVKSGYAKCDMQYNDMPEALKYTIFGNSTNTTDDYNNMTVTVNGRTNNAQAAANVFVNIINGLNEKLVQPIIGIVGGTPNYNTLVNASLSHAVINGDVHSNSDISIGVNNLQASRSKDRDFDGKDDECICQILCKKDSVNQYCTVCQGDYRKCDGDEQTDDDYNQVIFTAVNKIDFSAGKIANGSLIGSIIGSENDINTRVFVRNYQYVEQTQVALYIINKLNFDMITSTDSLRNAYTQTAEEYFEKSITLTAPQKSAVLNQANNLEYVSPGKYKLVNQKSIVYAATNAMANQVMTEVQGGKTLTDFLQPVTTNGIDTTATPESLLLYDGTTIDKESSVITFTKPDSDSTAELYIVDSENTNRSIMDMTRKSGLSAQAEAGYRFALAKTFQQYSNYIEVPNMKPYFIRAINRSVKNATTSKSSDSTDLETSDATSVKDAVKKTQTKLEKTIKSKDSLATVENLDGTFTKGAADATNDYLTVDEGKADTYVDNSYMSTSTLTNVKTSPILKYRLSSTTNDKSKLIANNDNGKSPYTFKKYSSSSSEHTTYNGINVFNSSGELNSAKNVIKEYSSKNSSKYGKNAVEKFNKSDVLVDSDYDDSSVHDYEKHYADDAVEKKKHYIENTLMLSDESEFSDAAPAEDDVFLMSNGTKKSTKKDYLDSRIKAIKENSKELSNQEIMVPADLRLAPVESRYKTLIDATLADLGYNIEPSTGVSYAGSTASISK